jgi:two-component system, OmpR family, response regulator
VRLLIIEDEDRLSGILKSRLGEAGFAVDVAGSAGDADAALELINYDAVVLDLGLPDGDGLAVLATARHTGKALPILILTARDAVEDRVAGLNAGADDYLTKPFALAELFARLRSLVRRAPRGRPPVLEIGDLALDPADHSVRRGGEPVTLTRKEFALLHYFMQYPGEALTRARLLEHVWDFAFDGDPNIVDVYVGYLRDKIDRPFGRASLETVRGVGYRLRHEAANAPPA